MTKIPFFDLEAARSVFTVKNVRDTKTQIKMDISGQTASAVQFLPDIDYKLRLNFDKATKKMSISGCHDAYPSYQILVDGRQIYKFTHKPADGLSEVWGLLLGECDVLVTENFELK